MQEFPVRVHLQTFISINCKIKRNVQITKNIKSDNITIVRETLQWLFFYKLRGKKMENKNIKGIHTVALMIFVTTIFSNTKRLLEVHMADMTNLDIIKSIIEIGITPVLLLVFVYYFLQKSKGDDKRVKDAYMDAQNKIEETNKNAREHESVMLAESVKREELIRQESEKRETLLRKEAEKRESMLMLNMEKITDSMNSITKTLDKIENSFSGIENRLEKIEHKV